MIRYTRLQHQFVQHLPTPLEPGVLYISMEYATAAHSCCCGCGEEVVTPLTPTDWNMTFDGEVVSLWPSIGSWTLACRSHYIIEGGRVIEAYPWSDRQIKAERRRDRAAKARYYTTKESSENLVAPSTDQRVQRAPQQGKVSRIGRVVARLWR